MLDNWSIVLKLIGIGLTVRDKQISKESASYLLIMKDLENKWTLYTLILLGSIGTLFINFQPVMVGAVADTMGLDEKRMSYFASSDLIGYAVASLTSFYWIHRIGWQKAALVALVLALSGNFISVLASQYPLLLSARILCGLGEGALTAIALAAIGASAKPDANMGIFLAVLLIISAAGLLLLPPWIEKYAADPIYLFFILLLGIVSFLVLFKVPADLRSGRTDLSQARAIDLSLFSKPVIMGLLGILILYIGVGAFWAFVERLATLAGLESAFIANAIGISLIVSLIGAFLPIVLDLRFGRIAPIIISLLVMIGSGLVIFGKLTASIYVVALSLFYIFWNIVLPYMVGLISEHDDQEVGAAMVPSMFSIGSALGPLIASLFITSDDLSPAAWLLVASCASAGVLYWIIYRIGPDRDRSLSGTG